jgi:hypothetical protein
MPLGYFFRLLSEGRQVVIIWFHFRFCQIRLWCDEQPVWYYALGIRDNSYALELAVVNPIIT